MGGRCCCAAARTPPERWSFLLLVDVGLWATTWEMRDGARGGDRGERLKTGDGSLASRSFVRQGAKIEGKGMSEG